MIDPIREFFSLNRTVVLFVYGLTFFVMGLAIYLSSHRRSRLRLARQLHWLAAFGILHGVYEWGDIFIPIQSAYLPESWTNVLWTAHVILLAASFFCLLFFGAWLVGDHWPWLRLGVGACLIIWTGLFFLAYFAMPSMREWHGLSKTLARYFLCLPGSVLAAYGLYYQARIGLIPPGAHNILRQFRLAGAALLIYGMVAGVFVVPAPFFPASAIHRELIRTYTGIPVEVLRSLSGMVLCLAMIRALEIFEIELDHRIEAMEIEQVQAAERERIGQAIHDGAMQGIYSASLILEAAQGLVENGSDAALRVQQARAVLDSVNRDLRSYMVSLRTPSTDASLNACLQKLIDDPRFQGLIGIKLECSEETLLGPVQVNHVLSIVQEALTNIVRHARATQARVIFFRQPGNGHRLAVEDNGQGFQVRTIRPGYGLCTMRDRARLLGGTLSVESVPGKGTRVLLDLPFDLS